MQEAKNLAKSTADSEVARLQQQNLLLARLLEQEKQNADRARDELIQRVSALLGDFATERNRSLKESFSEMTQSNAMAKEEMVQLGQVQGQHLDGVMTQGTEWNTSLDKRVAENKKVKEGGLKVVFSSSVTVLYSEILNFDQTIHSARSNISDGITSVQTSVMSLTSTFSDSLQKQMQKSNVRTNDGLSDFAIIVINFTEVSKLCRV